MVDHYDVLELPSTASNDEVKTAYRRLSRIWHPDKNHSPEATKKFQAIANAFQAICKGPDASEENFLSPPVLVVQRSSAHDGTIFLSWSYPIQSDAGQIYRVEVRMPQSLNREWMAVYEGPEMSSFATGAQPNSDYDFRIRCMRPRSMWSVPIRSFGESQWRHLPNEETFRGNSGSNRAYFMRARSHRVAMPHASVLQEISEMWSSHRSQMFELETQLLLLRSASSESARRHRELLDCLSYRSRTFHHRMFSSSHRRYSE